MSSVPLKVCLLTWKVSSLSYFSEISKVKTGNTQARGPYSASDWLQFSISQSELITTDLNAVLHKDENDPRRYSAGSATLFETNLS